MNRKIKNIIFATLTCALGASAIAATTHQGEEKMHKCLVHIESQIVIVDVEGDKIVIEDPLLEKQMREVGVFIPPPFRKDFGNKEYVKLEDPEFIEAFEKFFIPGNFRESVYKWKVVKN